MKTTNRKKASKKKRRIKKPSVEQVAPNDLQVVRSCSAEGLVMGGPQRPSIMIGPGPQLPTNWRA